MNLARPPGGNLNLSKRGSKLIRIVAFGDSITYAVGHADVNEEDTYCHLLQTELSEATGVAVKVINAGLNADTTTGALARLEQDVLRHKPDYVTIMFGVNDAGYYRPNGPVANTPRTAKEDFKENLRLIIERVLAIGAQPVLVTPVPMSKYYWLADLPAYREHGLNYLVDEYSNIIRDLAEEMNVPLIDVNCAFSSDQKAQELVPDGIHPDKGGQRRIADLFLSFFKKELGRN